MTHSVKMASGSVYVRMVRNAVIIKRSSKHISSLPFWCHINNLVVSSPVEISAKGFYHLRIDAAEVFVYFRANGLTGLRRSELLTKRKSSGRSEDEEE